jgi:hypothetical protein
MTVVFMIISGIKGGEGKIYTRGGGRFLQKSQLERRVGAISSFPASY